MNKSKVSIIIPTYNRGYIIEKSIKSILNQSYQNFELIIVDDCSKDDTEQVIKSFSDERIKYIRLQQNSGANKARNIGIQSAKYELVAFHDSDDEWHENKLEKQLKYLKEGSYDIVSCKYNQYVNDKFKSIVPLENVDVSKNLLNRILRGNFISTQTILGKKECFEKESFDNSFPRFQDWELSIRLVKNYKIGFLNIPLVDVYLQDNSISKDNEKAILALKKIYKKHYYLISKDKKLDSYFNKYIYISSILNRKPEKEYIKKSIKLNKNIKNIIFYLISLFKLEKIYFNYQSIK